MSEPGYRVLVRELDGAVDTSAVFGRLYAHAPRAFWLDSALVRPGIARFSFLGDAHGPLSEVVCHHVDNGVLRVDSAIGTTMRRESIFDYLRTELVRRRVEAPPLPFDFTGGYVGYFGYELKTHCGSPNRYRAPYPDAAWVFADRFLVVDHACMRTYLLALYRGLDGPTGAAAARDWLRDTAAILAALPPERAREGCDTPSDIDETVAVEPWLLRDRDAYCRDVEVCLDYLRAGESYEINLTNLAAIPADDSGLATYRRLRRLNPAPYAAYLRIGGIEIACSSPERFLRVGGENTVEAKPIKGTAPRDINPVEDALLGDGLAHDAKARAENLMIVDLIRNDLGRVCSIGSVHVPTLMEVETYRTLHQLVSTVRGRLRTELGVIDAVRACFPGGSMTGAPKLRTCEIIEELEGRARGVYSGSLGYLACNGTADLNIVIRTMVLVDDRWHIGAGGAIVLDSDPTTEYEEMLLKAAAPARAVSVAPHVRARCRQAANRV